MEENRSSSEKKGDRPRKNKHYDLNIRQQLIQMVEQQNKSLYSSAKALGIPWESARLILRTWREEGRIFESKADRIQRTRKQRLEKNQTELNKSGLKAQKNAEKEDPKLEEGQRKVGQPSIMLMDVQDGPLLKQQESPPPVKIEGDLQEGAIQPPAEPLQQPLISQDPSQAINEAIQEGRFVVWPVLFVFLKPQEQ